MARKRQLKGDGKGTDRKTENIYFFYGIIRLKNCFWIELLSPICGANRDVM